MKKTILLSVMLLLTIAAFSQPKPKQKEKPPTQKEMADMMKEMQEGMNAEDKKIMDQMMKGIMPEMTKKPGPGGIVFTDNKKLVPAKDIPRINSISKKAISDADIVANTALLYTRLMAKIPPAEKAIVTNVTSKAKSGPSLMEAATISFVQGRNYAAIGLAMKAVQADPKNVIYQNNLAAILSQSGYPEKAIPYLRKLQGQFPFNSTVLHNLGYAWLQLGEVDTAHRFLGYAAARNPANPETALCRGVIEELRGDPKKAGDLYIEAFEQAPNPFTEVMAKNVNAEGRLDKMDFNKLKNRISIYEYFKKDWITIPSLVDDVSAYENNQGIKNGFSKMFTALENKINEMAEASSAELQALAEKGEAEFVQTMMQENIKGISMISLPATYVQKILMVHITQWTQDYTREYQLLMQEIQRQKEVMTKYRDNDKCPDFDRKNNAFLQYANPLIRKFHATKIEEARIWLNAFCTWSWYITGNPKNTVLTQCISWTSYLVNLYASAIHDQYAIEKSCVRQNSENENHIPVPVIPNFTCPAVVSIPFGLDELRLSAGAVNFDDNDWGIKKVTGAMDHNLTLAYGISKNYITEPGKYGNPSTKTGNGSITTPGTAGADLTPLSKIMDELTPLDPALLNAGKKISPGNLNRIRNAAIARQMLNEMIKTECPGKLPAKKTRKLKFEVGIGKLELTQWDEELQAWVNDKGDPVYDKDGNSLKKMEVGIGELLMWDEDLQAWTNDKGDLYDKDYKPLKKIDVTIGEIEWEDVETSGLQTTISNGLDGLRTLTNFIKGLFD